MNRCKDCRYCKKEEVMENNLLMGIAIGTMFWPEYKDVNKCGNSLSIYHGSEVSDYHACDKFKE